MKHAQKDNLKLKQIELMANDSISTWSWITCDDCVNEYLLHFCWQNIVFVYKKFLLSNKTPIAYYYYCLIQNPTHWIHQQTQNHILAAQVQWNVYFIISSIIC